MNGVSLRSRGGSTFLKVLAPGALCLTMAIAGLSRFGGAEERPSEALPAQHLDFSILDTEGGIHSLRTRPGRAALVLVFLATECPIANGYVPELNRQFAALHEADSGVEYFGVISDRSVTRAAASKHVAEFKLKFPVLFDS